MAQIKEEIKRKKCFTSIFVNILKVFVFFVAMFLTEILVIFTEKCKSSLFDSLLFVIKDGFHQFRQSLMLIDTPFYALVIQTISSLLFYLFGVFACKIGIQV